MSNELLAAAFIFWIAGGIIALIGRGLPGARALLALGSLSGILAAILVLPAGTGAVPLPTVLAGQLVEFRLAPDALWLLGFGLVPAVIACWVGSPVAERNSSWLFGAALSLIGALGVFGLRQGAAFLISWEIMSLGGAAMILGERLLPPGRPVLFMLALLEVGTIALTLGIILLASPVENLSFATFSSGADALPGHLRILVGVLLVIGFGAKLGLLPFYEWFPATYVAGSGASGAILSGVVLNAAFFGLGRGLLDWVPGHHLDEATGLGIFLMALAVLSAILSVLYAFQQEDWRSLLSFSSAENASIAVAALATALIFRGDGLSALASLAWTVALLHLAGHVLAKGALFLAADGVFRTTGGYAIIHTDLLRRSPPIFGLGALFAAMSLAAMPPQAGFISEWYLFQTMFQGFHLGTLGGRLVLAVAGAGLALTVAVAFATFIKVLGIGLLGRTAGQTLAAPGDVVVAVALLGLGVFVLAAGMPYWLPSLNLAVSARFETQAVELMHPGLLLVPLTAKFAFISPTLLAIVMPLLAIIPLAMLLTTKRFAVRRTPVWYGGRDHDPLRASTTALTFANALRTFYSFVYRPREETARETNGRSYFVRRLTFTHEVAPIFGPYLFSPATRVVQVLADKLRILQSGNLNVYVAFIGVVLVVILSLTWA